MIHKISLWFQCWRSIFGWRYVAEVLLLQMEEAPESEKHEFAGALGIVQERIGNNVLKILGILPLEVWYFDDSRL